MRRRLNQRVVQALGRCNRDEDDFGMYVLADRRFATYFGRDSNRESIPDNMVAEIDMAQDHAEIGEKELCDRVRSFLTQDWKQYDSELQGYRKLIPASAHGKQIIDTSENEVFGWATLFANQNYDLAADRFEKVWDACQKDNLLETGAFWKFNWAKSVYLQSLMGNPAALEKALDLLDQAIKRGGMSSWFNRLRASLNRARAGAATAAAVANDEYPASLIRSFDDHLEQLGTKGAKFESYCVRISECLASDKHAEFCEGLEKLGILIGYQASRPKHKAATDNRWRGTFGNVKEVVRFEVKVEHSDGKEVTPAFVGQAHNQMNRAIAEYEQLGYKVCGTIATHLEPIDSSAKSSLGSLRIVSKSAIESLWDRVRLLFSLSRDHWSLDDVNVRLAAAASLRPKCPPAGWLVTTLQQDIVIIRTQELLAKWPQ
jgi:RAD3-like DEAD/DEAH box helicase